VTVDLDGMGKDEKNKSLAKQVVRCRVEDPTITLIMAGIALVGILYFYFVFNLKKSLIDLLYMYLNSILWFRRLKNSASEKFLTKLLKLKIYV
jgi:hypothetical protein